MADSTLQHQVLRSATASPGSVTLTANQDYGRDTRSPLQRAIVADSAVSRAPTSDGKQLFKVSYQRGLRLGRYLF